MFALFDGELLDVSDTYDDDDRHHDALAEEVDGVGHVEVGVDGGAVKRRL